MSSGPQSLDSPTRVANESPVEDRLGKRAIGGASFYALIDQGIVSFASALAAVWIGRYCGPDELGVYGLAVKVFWLIAGTLNALIWIPYTSVAPRLSPKRQQKYAGSTTVHLAFCTAAVCAALLGTGLAAQVFFPGKKWFAVMCFALVPFSGMMLLKEHLRRMLLATLETKKLLFVDAPIAALQLGAFGLLIWAGNLSSTTGLVVTAVACGWGIFWCMQNRERFQFTNRHAKLHWAYNFEFGKWLAVVAIAWSLGEALCYWYVESYHGLTEMGRYSAALTTVMLFNPIALTAQNLARSILSNALADGGRRALWSMTMRGTLFAFLGFGALFGILALAGDQMVTLFFKDKFTGLGPTVAALCLGLFAWVVSFPVEGALSALQDGRSMLYAGLLRFVCVVALGPMLIGNYGTVGVGYTLAIGSSAATLIQWYLFYWSCQSDER